MSIGNTGGRELRVRGLNLDISRDGKPLVELTAQNYFKTPSSQSAVSFVPFSLKPGETCAHNVAFLKLFNRLTEKQFRENLSALDFDIRRTIRAKADDDKQAVLGEHKPIQPFIRNVREVFVWFPGEYVAELKVNAELGTAAHSKKYRFTLFESDAADLRQHLDDYPFDAGLTYDTERHSGVNIPLTEHVV